MWVEVEHAALVETFKSADPDAPTLCSGWTTRHLLAHLVQRDRHPLRNAADMIANRKPGEERFMSRLVADAASPAGYEALIERFAAGPSRRNPINWAGEAVNFLEYVIHHEDVRRGGADPAQPRTLLPGLRYAIWRRLASQAKFAYRQEAGGVILAVPGGERKVVKEGSDPMVISGEPVELALHTYGRAAAAHVTITGKQG